MGATLHKQNDMFRLWMNRLNEQAYGFIGESVLDVMYDPQCKDGERFDRTINTHNAIFMVECALTKVFIDQGILPHVVIGVRLGEYAAAVTSGIWDMETALRAFIKQVKLLESTCVAGGMMAILHDLDLYSSDRYYLRYVNLLPLTIVPILSYWEAPQISTV